MNSEWKPKHEYFDPTGGSVDITRHLLWVTGSQYDMNIILRIYKTIILVYSLTRNDTGYCKPIKVCDHFIHIIMRPGCH